MSIDDRKSFLALDRGELAHPLRHRTPGTEKKAGVSGTGICVGPGYGAQGWMHWSECDEFSFSLMKALGLAQEGASFVSECFLAASRIVPGDSDSWYREWLVLADMNSARADSAIVEDNVQTALSNWLRASNYYRTAEQFLKSNDAKGAVALDRMRACSRSYLQHLRPKGEILEISRGDGSSIGAYFLLAPEARPGRPTVICVSGPGGLKDDYLYTMTKHALPRGISLLLVDFPESQVAAVRTKPAALEASVTLCFDYLCEQLAVDAGKIALIGDGLGAAYAWRAVNFENRFRAAVCDGGIWELRERAFALNWISQTTGATGKISEARRLRRHSSGKGMRTPLLVTLGACSSSDVLDVAELLDEQKRAGLDIQLKVFSVEETGASSFHADNPTISNEYIFDWIAHHLSQESPVKRHRLEKS